MAKILCLESATPVCSVALFDDQNLLSFREINEGYKHAEKLTVFVEEVFEESGISLSSVDAVAVSAGPGSYTGLRIGMSVAKGLCFANDLSLISLSTLEIMAAGALEKLKMDSDLVLCPMIDARRMEVYCALYDHDLNVISPPSAIVVDENFYNNNKNQIYYFGDGASKCKEFLPGNFIYAENIFPSARFMGTIALKNFRLKKFENIALVEPVYLKEFIPGHK